MYANNGSSQLFPRLAHVFPLLITLYRTCLPILPTASVPTHLSFRITVQFTPCSTYTMPRQKKNTSKGKAPTRLNRRQAPQETVEIADFGAMSNEALRLLLGQHQLRQTGTRREMISRLENHFQQSSQPPQRQNGSPAIEQAELAELIASIVDQRLSQSPPIRNNNQAIQDGGKSTSRPSPPAIEPSLPPPIHAGQQQQHGRQDNTSPLRNVPRLPPNFDASDPSHIAALHPEYHQPSLASHLTKTITTAITNGEYVDFANLLPLFSLLNDTLNSQLSLKVGEQGLTIPLPSSSKRPRIATIDKWLDAFAISFSVLVSAHPLRASDLIAYQQLIRDAARKFPGMAWYVYDAEFRRRASHNLSLKWGERDVQLYLDTFTGLPKSGCRSCGNTDHFSDACPLSTPRSRDAPSPADVCFNFNKGRPCARTPCPYKHRCNQPGCAAAHSGQEHSLPPQRGKI